MRNLLLSCFLTLLFFSTTLQSAPLSEEQGNTILKELKEMRKLLQRMDAKISQNNKKPRRPATVSTPTKGYPVLGDPNAPITLVEFTDYQCPYCKRFVDATLPTLKKQFIDTGIVKMVFRDMPLNFHPDAKLAAISAHCAGEQNAYWKMHDALFKEKNKFSRSDLIAYAKNISLDVGQFTNCLSSKRYDSLIRKGINDGKKITISGTPSFVLGESSNDIIQGKLIVGAKPLKTFIAQINALRISMKRKKQ